MAYNEPPSEHGKTCCDGPKREPAVVTTSLHHLTANLSSVGERLNLLEKRLGDVLRPTQEQGSSVPIRACPDCGALKGHSTIQVVN